MSDLEIMEHGKREICECSFTYNHKKGLIRAGRRGGTVFIFTPQNFIKLFKIIKHPTNKR